MLARTLEALGLQDQAEEQISLVLQHDPSEPGALEFRAQSGRGVRRRAAAGR
jgi:hypothetical protein